MAIMPEGFAVVDPSTPVFGLSASQIGRRVNAAAKAVGLGEGFTGHSGRVGMTQDLAKTGAELPALMTPVPAALRKLLPALLQATGEEQGGLSHTQAVSPPATPCDRLLLHQERRAMRTKSS